MGFFEKMSEVFDKIVFNFIKNKNLKFNLTTLEGETYKNLKLIDYSIEYKVILTTEAKRFHLKEIYKLSIFIKNFKSIKKEIEKSFPSSSKLSVWEGKKVYVYPYAKPPMDYTLLRYYPYSLLLLRKLKTGFTLDIVYKLGLSAFAFLKPYPKEFIKEDKPTQKHKSKMWSRAAICIKESLRREFRAKQTDKLLITFALRDGREITGYYFKNMLYCNFEYFTVVCPKNKRGSIRLFPHAIEDFLLEE